MGRGVEESNWGKHLLAQSCRYWILNDRFFLENGQNLFIKGPVVLGEWVSEIMKS